MTDFEKREMLKNIKTTKQNIKKLTTKEIAYYLLFLTSLSVFTVLSMLWLTFPGHFALKPVLLYCFFGSVPAVGSVLSAVRFKKYDKEIENEKRRLATLNKKIVKESKNKQKMSPKQERIPSKSHTYQPVQTNQFSDYDIDSIFDEHGFFRNPDVNDSSLEYVHKDIQKEKPKTLSLGKKIVRR